MSAEDAVLPMPRSGPIPERVARLEWIIPGVAARVNTNAADIKKLSDERIADHADLVNMGADVRGLGGTLNKLVWAIVTMALTLAGSTLALALTIASHAS